MKIILSLFILATALFANIGTITLLKGSATINREEGVLEVTMGDDVNSGDKINTYAKSKMQIILNDETIITLGANTEYIINSYDDKSDLHANMTLKRGLLKTITGKIGKIAPSRFKLRTKSATIGVRGTGYTTYIGANVENIVCFKGRIIITRERETIELPAGNMLLITDGIAKKFKMNMKFFNAQIKKVEQKQHKKESVKNENREKQSDNPPEEQNSDTESEVEPSINNTPPASIETTTPESTLNVDIVEDGLSELTQEVKVNVINEVIVEDIEGGAEFRITPIIDTPVENHDPSTGP